MTTDSDIDLNVYFQRIGFTGNAEPDIETLRHLHLLHVKTIPFENLNPLLKIPVDIDVSTIYEKMVRHNRGGYCYEQNILFQNVLQHIGFDVTPIAARVLWNKSDNDITAKTHMLLLVHLHDKDYIADVGFGGQGLTGPLTMEPGKIQETPHENYRITDRPGYYLLQTYIKGEWKTLYRFTPEPRYFIDYVIANWYISTHPNSGFTKSLSVARAGEGCRYTLYNNRFSIHRLEEQSDRQILTSPEAIRNVLEQVFNLTLPEVPNLDTTLKEISAIRYEK